MTSDALVDTLRQSDGLWSRIRTTPWRDLLHGRLTSTLDYRHAMTEHDLPLPLLKTVDEVVRRARLWPREKYDVAAELCAHFADGLQAGHNAEELQKTFGAPKASAKLIRRAKIRCRPMSWHLWHRGWQAMLCLCLLIAVAWSYLAIRYVSATPTITYDLIEQYDEQSRLIPENDRAWPFYRRGLVTIDRADLSVPRDGDVDIHLLEVLSEGLSNTDWPHAEDFLARHQAAVRLFAEGAKRTALGFVNRDPGNEAWRQWDSGQGWETYNGPGTGGPMTWLGHAQDLQIVRACLMGAKHSAIEAGDGPRAVDMALGLLHLADHGRQTHDGFIADLVAIGIFRQALQKITMLVLDHPELVTDTDLQQLSERIQTTLGGGRISYRMDGDLRMWEDYLQRIYTDDGQGSGRMTSEGLDELAKSFQGTDPGYLRYIRSYDDASYVDDLTAALAGSALATQIADRLAMQLKLREMHELYRKMVTDVDTSPSDSQYVKELKRLDELERIRYLPYTSIRNSNPGRWEEEGSLARWLVAVNLERDAALVAIALERHRRESGNWPQTLTDLVPDFLPTVPVDLFSNQDGQPLSYQLVAGEPVLYSVGPDHTDDGGEPPLNGKPGWNADSGDWVLLPPSEPSE